MKEYILYPAYMPSTSQGGGTHLFVRYPTYMSGTGYTKSVWIESASSVSAFHVFFFFSLRSTFQCFSVGSMHSLWNSQTSFFNNTFIKNGSHDTIHTFKNYFVTVFSVFSKISSIQTHSKYDIKSNVQGMLASTKNNKNQNKYL